MSEQTKHTPGKWESLNHGNQRMIVGDVGDDLTSTRIAIVEGNATSQLVTEANAILISLAPEMLVCLKDAVAEMRQSLHDIGGCDHAAGICACEMARKIDRAEFLIARAEGRQPQEASK